MAVDGITLRQGGLADVETLVRHRRAMWLDIGGVDPALLDAGDADYRRWVSARIDEKALMPFLAVHATDGPVASGNVWLQPVQPRPHRPQTTQPYLLSMYTDPRHRGKGIAEALVHAAMAWAREEGHDRMSLHASDMGRPLYAKLGFEPTAEMRKVLR